MRLKTKFTEGHARARFIQRTPCTMSFYELKEMIREGKYEKMLYQSLTRVLVRVRDGKGQDIWVVMNRKTNSMITVLSERQVRNWLPDLRSEIDPKGDEL